MIIKGKRFTDSFKLNNTINKSLGGDEIIESIHKWAKDVIDVLLESRPEDNVTYDCVIKMTPNPSNMKGCDDVKIEFWKTRRVSGGGYHYDHATNERNITSTTSGHHMKLIDCVNEINEKMDELLDRTNEPDVIELG